MAHKLILEAIKQIMFIRNKIFSNCTVYNNESKPSDFLACSSRRKKLKNVGILLYIDC